MTEENFDWLSLDENEEILWSDSPRIHSIIPALIIGVPMIPIGIGVVVIAAAYLSVKNTLFGVTSEGVYRKKGVLSRDVQKIGFNKIQNISFTQGIFGNHFGYGSVEISTAGGSGVEMRFRSVENPQEVQQLINQKIKKDGKTGEQEGMSEREILEEVLSELKEINEKL